MTTQDGYLFGFQGTVFPNPVGPDLVSQTLLRFFQNVIQINLGTSFTADALSCGLTHATLNYIIDGNVCPQAISFPLNEFLLKTTNFKFPLLSIHKSNREFQQFTDMKLMIKSDYIVNWILPPLSVEQYNVLYKYLTLVSDVLVDRCWRGSDINYNNGELVWQTAKIAYTLLNKDEHGSFLGNEGKTEFPGIKFHMSVFEESQFEPANYPEWTNAFIQTNNYDGYNLSLPIDNIADGYVNPNLSISSLSIESGPIAGSSVVNIIGDGFANFRSSQISTHQVTFNGSPVLKLIVKTNQSMIVITGPGAALGTGNVVITDSLENTSQLNGIWTYD
jgi:hypothetical protein